jgi:glycosyltransferase involved in cell wall biosynthesis
VNVLALAPAPAESPSTRLRITQLQRPLRDRGIDLTVRPFVDSATYADLYDKTHAARTAARLAKAAIQRLPDLLRARTYDAVLLQREAMLFGPPLFEWATTKTNKKTPIVLDLDDATWVAYDSPTYGRLGRWLKSTSKKTDRLIDLATRVTAGNTTIADYALGRGTPTTIVPTVVDVDRWTPKPKPNNNNNNDPPVIGWIGSHSTYAYLQTIVPALQELAKTHPFILRIVGADQAGQHTHIEGLTTDARQWQLQTEIQDVQSFDIGLYPLPSNDDWASGKSGLKAIQYMAVGIPFVVSPVGAMAAAATGEPNQTHLTARTTTEWRNALATLLDDPALRHKMGAHGRAHAIANYTLDHAADPLTDALTEALTQATAR